MCGGVAELQAADARPRETFAVRFGDGVAGIEQRGVDDRGIDELAFAGAVAVIERIADRDRRQEPVASIAEAGEAPQRTTVDARFAATHAAVLELDAGQAGAGLVIAGQAGAYAAIAAARVRSGEHTPE